MSDDPLSQTTTDSGKSLEFFRGCAIDVESACSCVAALNSTGFRMARGDNISTWQLDAGLSTDE